MIRVSSQSARVLRRKRHSLRLLPLALAVLAMIVVACSGNGPTATGPGDLGPTPNGTGPSPKPTTWPSSVVNSVIALGAADNDLGRVGSDLTAAVNEGDLQALLRVTDSSKTFLTGNQPNIPNLQAYPETKPLGDKLATAYSQMIAGLTKIHDSLTAGDSGGVTQGFQMFVAGSTVYGDARSELSDKVGQALTMKKFLEL
jgi:hypothetical protein